MQNTPNIQGQLSHQRKIKKGAWVEEKKIGTGGFGSVTLWVNEETNEQLAVKKCRLSQEMTAKIRHRWQLEVDIMKRLDHLNVVHALEVPSEIDVIDKAEMPLLAMEYCVGGDMRKVLNKPENCCGLRESQVRNLTGDIASAIEYLHSRRIIHRDLKPENIVIQEAEERVIYKLIDLGYAKELDQGSVCTSFVGTLQYLAPELFGNQKYTCTVDYWSFGTVVFEIITGTRPFLPTLTPVQWHQHISQKKDDQICAYFDNGGHVRFTNRFPFPHHLSRSTQTFMIQFLQHILMWDSKQRGGGFDADKRAKCFHILDKILTTKIINILCVVTNQLLTYPLPDDHVTLLDIQEIICKETKVPVEDQEVLFATGLSPDPKKPVKFWFVEPNDEDFLAFLFLKHDSKIEPPERKKRQPSDHVQAIIQEPTTILQYPEQKKAWAHSIHFISQKVLEYQRLLQAQRAALMSLLRLNSHLSKQKSKMSKDVAKLQAKITFFKECVTYDIDKYVGQAKADGITSEKIQQNWKKSLGELDQFNKLEEQVNTLEIQSTGLQTKLVEVQRSPYARNKHGDSLGEIEKGACDLYQQLRQTVKDQRSQMTDHTKMVGLIIKCMTVSEKAITELYAHLSKLTNLKVEVLGLLPLGSNMLKMIEDFGNKLTIQQKQRQSDIWKMLDVAVQRKPPPSANAIPGMEHSLLRSTSNLGDGPSVFFEKNMEQSMMLVDENQKTRHRFEDIFRSLTIADTSVGDSNEMDWGFLGTQDTVKE